MCDSRGDGRATERLGGTYDEIGFDVFGKEVDIRVSDKTGLRRKGRTPSRTYNGLLAMYVGYSVYKDFQKKTPENDAPRAFTNICVNAACHVKDRRDALEAPIETRARYTAQQASIAAENEGRKEAVGLAGAHERTECLRLYMHTLENADQPDEAAWVRKKTDWTDSAAHSCDAVIGDDHTPDGSTPKKRSLLPTTRRG